MKEIQKWKMASTEETGIDSIAKLENAGSPVEIASAESMEGKVDAPMTIDAVATEKMEEPIHTETETSASVPSAFSQNPVDPPGEAEGQENPDGTDSQDGKSIIPETIENVNTKSIVQDSKVGEHKIEEHSIENLDRGDFQWPHVSEPQQPEDINSSKPAFETDNKDKKEIEFEEVKDITPRTLPTDGLIAVEHADTEKADIESENKELYQSSSPPAETVQVHEQMNTECIESVLGKTVEGETEDTTAEQTGIAEESVKESQDEVVAMEVEESIAEKGQGSSDSSEKSNSDSRKSDSDISGMASCKTNPENLEMTAKTVTVEEYDFKEPKDTVVIEQKGKSYESEFEKFLHFQSGDTEKQAERQSDLTDQPGTSKTEIKKSFKRKMFDEEESDSSSWYKPPRNGTDKNEGIETPPSFDANKGLLHAAVSRLLPQDENSNSSMPDSLTGGQGSVVSSNVEENSCLSYPEDISLNDESSNMSASDSFLVPTFGAKPDMNLFDESANLNPPNNRSFMRSDTPTSTVSDSTGTTPKRVRRGTLAIAAEEASEHRHDLTAADLFEYQWPQESGAEWYMLQEQISIYLDVKSFKRKYPDLFRRVCDKQEKEFLREKGVVSETQSDLGLTAVRSEEVHELMNRDYPEKYREYCVVLHEKERQHISDKHKDYDVPKLEKSKIKEYTKKAMKSAAEWNLQLQRERKEERRAYFDMQTFAIHYPQNRFKKLPAEATKVSPYPVSLIPGQFQEYCKAYNAEELKYLPLNTALFDPPKKMDRLMKQPTPEPDSEDQEEKQQSVSGSGSDSDDDSSSNSDGSSAVEEKADTQKVMVKTEVKEQPPEPAEVPKCRICSDSKEKKKKPRKEEELVQCSECKRSGHPSCLDLTNDMVQVIKTYPWQCMECKTCVECMDPYDEDKMLFCDRCDRGYHTFCVGLRSLPTGNWECVSCKGDSSTQKSTSQKATPKSTTKSRRGRK